MTKVYIVRHGETEWNLKGLQQGHLDSPLTQRGIAQAKLVARGLEGRGIEAIYASDLVRTRRTAEIIDVSLGLGVSFDSGLRERNLGILQGLTMVEFADQYPEDWRSFTSRDPDYAFPRGESARQRQERNVTAATAIARRKPGSTILLVAHGGTLSSMLCHSLDMPTTSERRYLLVNAAINLFSFEDDTWRLEIWGETAHLGSLGAIDDT